MILISNQKLLRYLIGLASFYNDKSKKKFNNRLKINNNNRYKSKISIKYLFIVMVWYKTNITKNKINSKIKGMSIFSKWMSFFYNWKEQFSFV